MIPKPYTYLTALALATVSLAGSAVAQDAGALLDALVQEGVIKESKAESIRAKLSADYKKTSAGKIQLDSSIKELKLYGDARFRFQWDETGAQNPVNNSNIRTVQQRERIRLRLGADFKLSDDFFGGIQLSTGAKGDSDNSTVGDSTEGGSSFSKVPVFISKAFLGWEPVKGFTAVVGKQTNPFYGNDQGLVWDYDINPAGLSEKAELHKLFGWTGPWEVTATAGQFIFQDNKEAVTGTVSATSRNTTQQNDTFLLQGQLAVAYKFNDNNKLTVAPGFLAYNNESTSSAANGNSGSYAAANGSQGFQLLLLPGDYSTKIAGLKTKFLWDFAYNADGKTRAKDVYGIGTGTNAGSHSNVRTAKDDVAWLAGVALGENKKKGDFSFLANYRQVGITAVDPNLNDSDFGGSYLNIRGFKVGAGYNLSNAVVLSLAYQNAFNLRHELSTPSSLNVNNNQIIQADVTVKF